MASEQAEQVVDASSTCRELPRLPKAHLHVHFPNAVVRRATLQEWSEAFDPTAGLEKAREEAEQARANGLEEKALKYERRGALLSQPMAAFCKGESVGATEAEQVELLQELDAELPQPGAAGIWDAQWISKELGAEKHTHRVLREVYEDAVLEGIVWTELCCNLVAKDRSIRDEAAWAELFGEWQSLENEFSGKTAVRFIAHCPKTPEDAETLFAYLKKWDTCPVAGFGQWGREVSACTHDEIYRICVDAGWPLVCVHAGESLLQAACPSGDIFDDEVARAYSGVQHVRDAMVVGARRIGHGIEAVKDQALLDELRIRNDVAFEVCPISNRRLRCCEDGLAKHPLTQLLQAGVPCCLAADDPAFFGSSNAHGLVREYIVARHIMALDDASLAKLARYSILFSLAPEPVKQKAFADIDAWLA